MNSTTLYRLVDDLGLADDYRYDDLDAAIKGALDKPGKYAVEALIYELVDTELVWTPNDEEAWPEDD